MKVWKRLRELAVLVAAWFRRDTELYQNKYVSGPPGSGLVVVHKVLIPKLSFSRPTVQTKSVKFMTDFRLLCDIPAKYFANPDVTVFEITNYANTDVRDSEVDFDNSVELDDIEAHGEEPVALGEFQSGRMVSSSMKRRKDLAGKKPVHVYESTVSPKEALDDLATVPTPANLEGLDDRVSLLTQSLTLIRVDRNGGGVSKTTKDMLERLRNRQVYRDHDNVREFFDRFKCTTDELIVKLLDTHQHLRIGPVDDFLPEMPATAQQTMLDYSQRMQEWFSSRPCFYIIAKATDFAQSGGKRKKRDPILLVQAPFGLYWQILGAWGDEEMLALKDL